MLSYWYVRAVGMSLLEWAWVATFALVVPVYAVHFAQPVLPDFFQTLLSYGNRRKNGSSLFADVPKRCVCSACSTVCVSSEWLATRLRAHTHTTEWLGKRFMGNLLRQQALRISSLIFHLLTLHIVHMRVCLRPCMRAQTVMHSSTSMHCAHSRPSFPICLCS